MGTQTQRSKDWNNILSESHDNWTLLIDDLGGTLYIGRAPIGAATSDPVWQIRRFLQNGTVLGSGYAGGLDTFNQIWDNRASLIYS